MPAPSGSKAYLGDGVYAWYEETSGQIWCETEGTDGRTWQIAFEPEVFGALLAFANRVLPIEPLTLTLKKKRAAEKPPQV